MERKGLQGNSDFTIWLHGYIFEINIVLSLLCFRLW